MRGAADIAGIGQWLSRAKFLHGEGVETRRTALNAGMLCRRYSPDHKRQLVAPKAIGGTKNPQLRHCRFKLGRPHQNQESFNGITYVLSGFRKKFGSDIYRDAWRAGARKITTRFLEGLGFKSTSDRMIIGVLKALGFLSESSGAPTERYFNFLDGTRSALVLAEGIREAYADLFQLSVRADTMVHADVANKFKTLSQGQYTESVIKKMAMTFVHLCKHANFEAKPATVPEKQMPSKEPADDPTGLPEQLVNESGKRSLGGIHYNIQIILPESRDPKVYDALFKSLRDHLID